MTLLLLLLCFFLSGFAALLYETAWTRELAFVFGTSELAVVAVLAAYMGGLALGAFAAGRLVPRIRRPVLAYGLLELGIALGALAVPAGIALTRALYGGLFGGLPELPDSVGTGAFAFHLASTFLVLLPCTALMGATLPLLARYAIARDDEIGARVGLLYAVNTFGAIAGTLVAAFVLLPALGLRSTVYVGVAVNLLVFAAVVLLVRSARETRAEPPAVSGGFHPILPAIALSGAAAFVYEVLWFRLLGYVLGASTTAFATMLACFLLGIALGSAVAARLARDARSGRLGFAVVQLGTALAAFVGFAAADEIPALARALGASINAPWTSGIVAAATLLPLTLWVGASFPFAVRVLARGAADAPSASARVYGWNTVGSIAGSIAAGFLLLPTLGLAGTLGVGVAANLLLAVAFAAGAGWTARVVAAGAVAAAIGAFVFPPGPPEHLLRHSAIHGTVSTAEIQHVGVGRAATVVLEDRGTKWRITTNGLPEATISRPAAPRVAVTPPRWLAMLPVLARPETASMLIVGLGGGHTAGAVPSPVREIDVVEIEAEVVRANRIAADRRGGDPLADPRLRVRIGDARGALVRTDRRWDAIVSQPSHPWTAGASHLYTREFFALARAHLNEGGVFAQWIGLAFVDPPTFRALLAALVDVFDHVEVYRPTASAALFVGSDRPFDFAATAPALLARSGEPFGSEGLHGIEDLMAARVLDAAGSDALAEGSPVNSDDHNRLATQRRLLGGSERAWLDALVAPFDPLPGTARELDPAVLGRKLGVRREPERAGRAAEVLPETHGALLLGWRDLELARLESAAGHFRRALAGAPDSRRAREGLALATGDERHAAPSPLVEAVLRGGRRRGVADWQAIQALDAVLAATRPAEPLFAAASELRAAWRAEIGTPEEAAGAIDLVDGLLERRQRTHYYLLRARAALRAGRGADAWGSLAALAETLGPGRGGAAIARSGLGVAERIEQEAPAPWIARHLAVIAQAGALSRR